MSRPVQKVQIDSRTVQPAQTLSQEHHQISQRLDTRLQDLKAHAIVQPPYLLSVPSSYPYRYSSRFVNSWFVGTPFAPNEEELQYLSFLPHQHHDEELLRVLGSWADEQGNLVEETSPVPMVTSTPNTPLQQPNRKKISLKDYKSKEKAQEHTVDADHNHESMRAEVKRSGDMKQKLADSQQSPKIDRSDNKETASTHSEKTKVQSEPARSRNDDLPTPRKRRKLDADDNSPPEQETLVKRTANATSKAKSLPPILSPTLPASDKVRSQKGLPVLLLPDLPPALVKEIARTDVSSDSDGQAQHHPPPSKKSQPLHKESQVENKHSGTATKEHPHARHDSVNNVKERISSSKVAPPQSQPHLKMDSGPITPMQNGTKLHCGPQQRRIIVLKYGKKNRKRVESLLRFAPRPKKIGAAIEDVSRKHPDLTSISHRAVLENSPGDKKRAAEPSPERPVKKPKTTTLLQTSDKTRTPAPLTNRSPAPLPVVTKVKQELATPKLESKSIAMQRVASSDDFDAKTPPISQAVTSTPLRSAGANQRKTSPLPNSASVSREDRIAWDELKKRYHALGRALKRESTALSERQTEHDQTLSVIFSIEAMLCFMVNLAAQTHAHPSADPGWATMLPYQIQVSRASRKYRHLHGLVIQLGAICRQIYHNHNIDRLAKEPIPSSDDFFGSSTASAPTPGSDGTTKPNANDEHTEKSKRRAYTEFRDNLVQNSRELQSAWLEGSRHLSPSLLEREYPKTWSLRAKDTSRRGSTITSSGAATSTTNPTGPGTTTSNIVIGKEFWLPLDPITSAFEGMRFSLSFLEEWASKEKIGWKTKIDL